MTNKIENLNIYELRIGSIVDTTDIVDRPALWAQEVRAIYAVCQNHSVYLSPADCWVDIRYLREHKPKPKEDWKVGDKVNAFLKSEEHDVSEKVCTGRITCLVGQTGADVEGLWTYVGGGGDEIGEYHIPLEDITLVESYVPEKEPFKVGAKKAAFFNAGRCRRGEIVDIGSVFEGEQTYDVRGVWDGSPIKGLSSWFVKSSDLCEPEPESQAPIADGCAEPGLATKINPDDYRHPVAGVEEDPEEDLTSVEKLLGANNPVTNFDYTVFKNCAKPITEGGKALEAKYSKGIAAMGKPDDEPAVAGVAEAPLTPTEHTYPTNTHTGPDFTTIEQLLNVIIEELRGIAISVSRTQQ